MEEFNTMVKAATEKDYVGFKEAMLGAVQNKTDEHPGVQAYREDMKYYDDLKSALDTVVGSNPENKEPTE